MIELKNSKTQYLGKAAGRERYVLDAFIGAVQMRSLPIGGGEGQWQDIKPRLVRDADGWHIEGAPYFAEIKDSGARLFCPDRNERNNYLRLPAPALFSGPARNVCSNAAKLDGTIMPNQITMPADWGEMRIVFSNTGMHFEILFTKAPPSAVFGKDSPRILLDAETGGLDIEQLLKSRSGTGIPQPRLIAVDLSGNESQKKWLDWNYKNGQLELGFDFGNLPFPILLKNTTIDVQVGASADDCRSESSTDFSTTVDSYAAGYFNGTYNNIRSGARFLNVTVPNGATIAVAYMTLRCEYSQGTGTINTNLMAEDADNATTFSTLADYNGRARTAVVAWNNLPAWTQNTDYNTTSLVTPIQTVVNREGWVSGNSMVIFWENGSGSTARHAAYSWDESHTYAPKLHIEYSTGGATAKTSAETGAGTDGSSLLATMAKSESGGGSESATGRGLVIKDSGGGVDALTALIAAVLASETGSGVEQSTLTSIGARLSAETGSGVDIAALVARLASGDVGLGADTGVIPGLKSIFGGDGGIGDDALKALIGTSGVGSEIKLPGRQGQVKIPSKGVSL
jgi:hypothetical protein